jgi:hypothetical protein
VSFINRIHQGVVVVGAMFLSAVAGAAPVSWSNASGSSANFSWSGGANENGLAGSPITASNFFLFIPSGLKAVASNGGSDSVSEIIHVILTPAANLRITNISATFSGDESVFGTGSAGYTASLTGTRHGTSQMVSSALAPADTTTQAAFNDNLSLSIPQGYGAVDFQLLATMHANAGQGASAISEMKVIQFSVGTASVPMNIVPLPAAVVTFPIGAAVAGFATRRMKKRA